MASEKINIYDKLSSMDRLNRLLYSVGGFFILIAAIAVALILAILLSSLFELLPIYKIVFLTAVFLTALVIILYFILKN